jgi:hypothetical protein
MPILFKGYYFFFKKIDKGCIEFFGPTGLSHTVSYLSKTISKSQTGYFYHYGCTITAGLIYFLLLIELVI